MIYSCDLCDAILVCEDSLTLLSHARTHGADHLLYFKEEVPMPTPLPAYEQADRSRFWKRCFLLLASTMLAYALAYAWAVRP